MNGTERKKEFVRMLGQCRGIVMRVCLYYVGGGDRDALGDAYQEVVCALWESWPRYRAESDVTTWVYQVALNTMSNEWRRRRKRPKMVPIDEALCDTLADEATTDRYQRLHDLIAKLPDKGDQQILLMHLDRRPSAEIAAMTGLTPENVRKRLSRIKQELIKLKKQYYDDE